MDKAWAGVLVPTIALVFFAVIPYIDRSQHMQGLWFGTRYSVRLTVIAAIYALIVSFGLVVFDAGDTTGTERLTRWMPAIGLGHTLPGPACGMSRAPSTRASFPPRTSPSGWSSPSATSTGRRTSPACPGR